MATSRSALVGGAGAVPLPVSQADLDLAVRPERTSALAWRGQFNPMLVEHLLDAYARPGGLVCDPFAGSGTVLFEAARAGLPSLGAEVNPAAVELASVAALASIAPQGRADALEHARAGVAELVADGQVLPCSTGRDLRSTQAIRDCIVSMPSTASRSLLAASVMLAMRNGRELTALALERSAAQVEDLVHGLPTRPVSTQQVLADARHLPSAEGSAALVLTSPPYINVFNYHHNYRPAVELLGWEVLRAARSEVGSNRKHRENRFLTVVQYAMDMARAVAEMGRVLDGDGVAVLVVGRESNVLGCAFRNGELVLDVSREVLGVQVRSIGQRSFKNRFGALIYEDILVLERWPEVAWSIDDARAIAVEALRLARPRCAAGARPSLERAIERSHAVVESPLLEPAGYGPAAR